MEQYWRDNRLNMIHEGTHGVQAMDLLGRKVLMEEGRGLKLLAASMLATAQAADALAAGLGAVQASALHQQAAALRDALQQVGGATQAVWASGNPTQALANAVPYLQAFGHTVLAWVWLDVALAVLRLNAAVLVASSQGKLRATAYFYHYELPKIGAWFQVVKSADLTCSEMGEEAF